MRGANEPNELDERGAASVSPTLRVLGLIVLVIAAAVVVYLAVAKDGRSASTVGEEPTTPAVASPSASADIANPPEVADAFRLDFSSTPQLPATAGESALALATYDNAAAGSPLSVVDGLLTHSAPRAKSAAGSLEAQLAGPVQKIGAVISFPKGRAGSALLVGWSDSLVAAGAEGAPEPTSGLRLEVDYGIWQLSVYDTSEVVIAGDEYEPSEGALQQFEVYRSGDRAWVVDPSGTVTTVQNPAIAALAGPWACWQIAEETTRDKPVGLQQIWAG